MGGCQAFHKVGQVFRLRTCEVDFLFLPGDRLADVILTQAVIKIAKPCIDNAVLNLDQLRFAAKVFFLRHLKQCHEALGPGRCGYDVFDLKGRFRLLGVKVPERPFQQFRRIAGHYLPASLGQVGRFEVVKSIGASNRWAESAITQQVIVDPLTSNLTDWGNRIVFIRIEQIDVVAPLQVIQWEHFAGQELVQKPQPPGILAGRFRSDIFKEIFLRSLLKQAGEDCQIRPVILECEFKMVAQCVPRPVLRWVDLLDDASA
jgi:hypothetical protein